MTFASTADVLWTVIFPACGREDLCGSRIQDGEEIGELARTSTLSEVVDKLSRPSALNVLLRDLGLALGKKQNPGG